MKNKIKLCIIYIRTIYDDIAKTYINYYFHKYENIIKEIEKYGGYLRKEKIDEESIKYIDFED